MKTGSKLRYPSKISLLKDLAGAFWREQVVLASRSTRFARGNLEIVKEPKDTAVIKQLMELSLC